MIVAVECQLDEAGPNQIESDANTTEMKGRFGQNRLTSQQWLRRVCGDADRPVVEAVVPVGERDQKASVRNPFHPWLNPLREERFFGPRTQPASSMYAW